MRRTLYGGSGTGHGQITQDELLNFQRRGQFPDESVRMKTTPIHYVNTQTNNRYQGDIVRRTIIIVNVILSNLSVTTSFSDLSKSCV